MSETIDAARKLIADRLRDLEAEAEQLQRALQSMGESVRPSSGQPNPAANGLQANAVDAPWLRAASAASSCLPRSRPRPGARPSELAGEIGISPNQVHGLIAKARAEKLIAKKDADYVLK